MITNKTIAIYTAYAHKLPRARAELLDRLTAQGNRLVVLGLEDQSEGDAAFAPLGIRYVHIPLSRHGLSLAAEKKGIAVIAQALQENNVQAVLSYGIRLVLSVNRAARKSGIRPVNVINGAGTLFADGSLKGKLLRTAIFPVLRSSFACADSIIFQNSDDLKEFTELGLADQAKCLLTHGSGVNLEKFPMSGLPAEDVFAIDCRLSAEKGIWELLQAFHRLRESFPEARLKIAGGLDGLDEKAFREAVSAGGVEYPGEVSDIRAFLQECRFFVYPSYYREGVPRSVLEAMACGRPVITTDMPGCRDTVEEGKSGYLVPPRDADSLYQAMLKACRNRDGLDAMGRRSREIAEEKFDVYRNNEIVIDALEKAAGGR